MFYFLARTLSQLEDDIPPCEAQMDHWKTNLAIMESKERQYLQQYSNYKVLQYKNRVLMVFVLLFYILKIEQHHVLSQLISKQHQELCALIPTFLSQAMLNRVGYSPDISHGVLVEMAEHRKDLEKKTKPILETLRSYQDLPPVVSFSR